MKRIKKLISFLIIGMAVSSCTYDFIKEDTTPVNPSAPVSFSTQILPIFNNGSKCTSCHKPGGQTPDLTTANAFASINSNSLVNTAAPETSVLYMFPNPETSTHTWQKYTSSQAQLVLIWIQQGAQNN